jgi:hypothetical protein
MTLVTTTASSFGITVVADTAVSRRIRDEPATIVEAPGEKIFYSERANIALAGWGSADFPKGESYAEFLASLADGFDENTSLEAAAERVAHQLDEKLRALAEELHGWGILRRGVHVSGFVRGIPHIYHVHTGDPNHGSHAPRVYRDYPDIHIGTEAVYLAELAGGKRMQLFNGFHELFGLIGESMTPLRRRLEAEFNVKIPAPSLQGQLEFDRALVTLAGGLLRAGGLLSQVSIETTYVAFTPAGRAQLSDLRMGVPRLSRAESSGTTLGLIIPIDSGAWSGGKHGDVFDPDAAT